MLQANRDGGAIGGREDGEPGHGDGHESGGVAVTAPSPAEPSLEATAVRWNGAPGSSYQRRQAVVSTRAGTASSSRRRAWRGGRGKRRDPCCRPPSGSPASRNWSGECPHPRRCSEGLLRARPAPPLNATTLNIQSPLGLIILIGIVVNGAMSLVGIIDLLRREYRMRSAGLVIRAGSNSHGR